MAIAIGIVGPGGSRVCAAETQTASPPSALELQVQVRALTAAVDALARKDRGEIDALQAQVRALQARLAQTPAQAPAASLATPRAKNDTAPRTLAAATDNADAQRALPRVTQNATHHFALQSDDGRYTIGFAGTAQFDVGDYLSVEPRSRLSGPQNLSDGANARRARIGVSGTAAGDWSYAFVYDAGNSQDTTAKGIQTAQIVYGGFRGVALEIGYSNTFFTLEQATSGNDTLFLERATPTNIATSFNTGDSRTNAGVRVFGDRYWIGGYLTGPASGDSHTQTHERLGAFERVAFQLLSDQQRTVHLGFGLDQLLRAPNSGPGTPDMLTLSDQPELRIDPTALVNTGAIGSAAHPITGGYVTDLEAAATWNSLFFQGEYFHYEIQRRGLASNAFNGGYAQVGWALTGESRRYNPQAGAYYRILPTHPFSLKDGSWGAVELAARVSYIDLTDRTTRGQPLTSNDAGVNGGAQLAYALGLNWYPNDLIRFMVDFNHVRLDRYSTTQSNTILLGSPVGIAADAISMRSQVTF